MLSSKILMGINNLSLQLLHLPAPLDLCLVSIVLIKSCLI